MNLSNINFNLLRILDALLNDPHLTRSGEKLGLSQSAMSNALYQLRNLYCDSLLVRGQGSQMRLTSLAESLRMPVRQALNSVEYAFSCMERFQPESSDRVFNIGMSDYIEYVLLPPLIKKVYSIAPSVKINIHHLNYFNDVKLLEQGQLDLVIGHFPEAATRLMTQRLFSDDVSFVARKNHPIHKKRNVVLKDIVDYPLVMVSFVNDPTKNFLDHFLEQHHLDARVKVTVPHALMALQVLKGTNFITHTANRIAKPIAKQIGLSLFQPTAVRKSFQNMQYTAQQYWHKIVHNEPSHQWLRQMVKQVSETL